MKCSTKSTLELENLIIEYLKIHPKSTIEQVSKSLNFHYLACYRILNGRKGSRSLIGLVSAGVVCVSAGFSSKNKFCCLYEVI